MGCLGTFQEPREHKCILLSTYSMLPNFWPRRNFNKNHHLAIAGISFLGLVFGVTAVGFRISAFLCEL